MTENDIRAMIRKQAGHRKVNTWAAKHGISQSYVSDFLAGKRGVGSQILDALGLEAVYRKKSVKAHQNTACSEQITVS